QQSRLPSSSFSSVFSRPFPSLEHHSICINDSPPAASFKQLYRTRPKRRPEPTCNKGGASDTALAFMGNKEGRQQLPGEGDRRWPWFNRIVMSGILPKKLECGNCQE